MGTTHGTGEPSAESKLWRVAAASVDPAEASSPPHWKSDVGSDWSSWQSTRTFMHFPAQRIGCRVVFQCLGSVRIEASQAIRTQGFLAVIGSTHAQALFQRISKRQPSSVACSLCTHWIWLKGLLFRGHPLEGATILCLPCVGTTLIPQGAGS